MYEGFQETDAYLSSCEADCRALSDEAVLRAYLVAR